MKERTKKILLSSVENFIKYGKPITSEMLFELYDFGIKPAMIRWELNALSRNGYFYQFHPSGGRYPTNKAYRFFIENLYKENENLDRENFLEVLTEKLFEGDIKEFIDEVSEKMGVLGIGYKVKENYLYLNGLYDLFRNLEVSQNEIFLEIIKYFETFPQKIISQAWQNYLEQTKRRPQIFVGKNKFIKSDVVSVFADCVNSKDDKFIIFMIGPKRIDYAKILKLFRIINRREKDYF